LAAVTALQVRERPRLLVLNQYYAPRVEATAHLLTELCEGLAADWDVTVVTGAAPGERRGRTRRNGVTVVRVRGTALGKRDLLRRGLDYGSFAALSLSVGALQARPDVVLAMTDPPFVGAVARAVAGRFDVPFVLVAQDLFPETAVATGALPSPAAVSALRALVEPPFRTAARVVALGETMRRRLEEKGVAPERIRVIPNWTDTEAVRPGPQDNAWSREHGLAGRFVVMHAGNLGWAQDLETLVRASTLLGDAEELVVALVGSGSRADRLRAMAGSLGTSHVRFLGHQPRERMSEVLAAGTLHVVGLAQGLAGYVVPSRVYGILAAGRAVIAAADAESETAELVRRVRCGLVVPPGNPDALAGLLRAAVDGALALDDLGARGRAYAEEEADRRVAVERYRALLGEVLAESRAGRIPAETDA
jgi:colanic acid biosynthesis glycosyl transferase WcaI